MNEDVYLSVIIPAYNEEKRIGKTIDIIGAYLARQPFKSEIIVSDAASPDKTAEIVRQKIPEITNLKIISQKNKGKGEGVKVGMLAAKGRIRLFTDADNSTDISHFDKMRPFFDQGYEVVICSRDSKDAPGARQAVAQVWYKRLMGTLGNLFIQWVAIRGVWDTQCGFKAFRDFAAEKIFSQQRVPGWGFDIETLALAKALGYKIGIIPAYWINDPRSHVKLSGYLQVLRDTLKIRFNFWRNRYIL
ncbi:MAG: glycosyltransferase family 2 protein [Candidatus Niyogibacteria bacterium]|nr:MAG: glycosyltransferase family 2 protein [Candidatus Niyogibacteria bacterium]